MACFVVLLSSLEYFKIISFKYLAHYLQPIKTSPCISYRVVLEAHAQLQPFPELLLTGPALRVGKVGSCLGPQG